MPLELVLLLRIFRQRYLFTAELGQFLILSRVFHFLGPKLKIELWLIEGKHGNKQSKSNWERTLPPIALKLIRLVRPTKNSSSQKDLDRKTIGRESPEYYEKVFLSAAQTLQGRKSLRAVVSACRPPDARK